MTKLAAVLGVALTLAVIAVYVIAGWMFIDGYGDEWRFAGGFGFSSS